jgi:hypothetical protein
MEEGMLVGAHDRLNESVSRKAAQDFLYLRPTVPLPLELWQDAVVPDLPSLRPLAGIP